MIIIKSYLLMDNRLIHYKILEQYKDSEMLPFDCLNKKDCVVYLKSKYSELHVEAKHPVAFSIYHFGGIKGQTSGFKSLFPGYDKEGNRLNIMKYGRLESYDL